MAVPVALNIPINNSVNLSSDIGTGSSSNASDRQFSEHFDNHVERIKDKGNSTNGAERNREENVVNKRSTKALDNQHSSSKAVAENNNVSDKSTQLSDASHKSVDDDKLQEESVGLPLVASTIAENGDLVNGLSLLIEGGNSLPITADSVPLVDVAAEVIDKPFLDINVDAGLASGDIVFDPLAQTTESAPPIASMMLSNQLPVDKIRLNSKPVAGDFSNPFTTSLSLEKLAELDSPVLKNNNLFKADALSKMGGDFSLVKSSGEVDLPINNIAGLTSQSISAGPLLADKPTLQVDVPVSSSRWGQEFGQRIQWMVNQSVSGAQIRITPQHMGPIEVRVQMQNDQATIAFTAQHGATREAIDAALPRLREMLSDQNVNVVDVDISQHSFAEQRDQQAESQETAGRDSNDIAFNDDESMFDSQDNAQQRHYSGLFSDFA